MYGRMCGDAAHLGQLWKVGKALLEHILNCFDVMIGDAFDLHLFRESD